MKKRILLFTAIAALGCFLFSSYSGGPALNAQNRTGARSSTADCSTGGCHGTGAGTTVSITVDSTGGVATTRYKPGNSYTVKIHGTNTASQPRFGFQYAVVSGTGGSQTQAGTLSGFPAGVTTHSLTGTPTPINFVEQTSALIAPTAGTYDVQFLWMAPSTAVGTITMYCTLNAVDFSGSTSAADRSANTSITLTPIVPSGVAEITNNVAVTAFPNPVMNTLHLQTEQPGNYSVNVYDLNGRTIAAEQVTINGVGSINASNWAVGLYYMVIQKDGKMQIISVAKQ